MMDPSKEMFASMVYNPYYIPGGDDLTLRTRLDGYAEANPMVRALIREYTNQKRVIGSWNIACAVIRAGLKDGVVITDDDIIEAFAIGPGGGMEFEFPYE